MSANFNPYVQGWRVGNAPSSNEQPSIFGALPGTSGNAAAAHHGGTSGSGGGSSGGGAGAPDPNAVVFHITDFRPNVLNASVVDARGRQCHKIVTDAPQQPQRTVYYDNHRRTVALIDWTGVRPSVEMPGLLPRQALRSWLHTGPDRAYVPSATLTAKDRRAHFRRPFCLDLGLWRSGASRTSGFPMGNTYAYVLH
jgi:hypothetical protein